MPTQKPSKIDTAIKQAAKGGIKCSHGGKIGMCGECRLAKFRK